MIKRKNGGGEGRRWGMMIGMCSSNGCRRIKRRGGVEKKRRIWLLRECKLCVKRFI